MVKLTKNKNNTWKISDKNKSFDSISSIETAAHFMEHYYKIKDEAIDDALIEMSIMNRSVATFNDVGEFVATADT